MIIVGVDPGKSGGVTILDTYSFRTVQSLSLTRNTIHDIFMFLSEIKGGEPNRIVNANVSQEPTYKRLNRVVSPLPKQVLEDKEPKDNTVEMWLEEPGQLVVPGKGYDVQRQLLAGMVSSRKLGRALGLWEGIATALSISVELVPPKKWQKVFNCQTKGDKKVSLKRARDIFPFMVDENGKSTITHAIADSLLLAAYGYIHYTERMYTVKTVTTHSDFAELNRIQNHYRRPKSKTQGTNKGTPRSNPTKKTVRGTRTKKGSRHAILPKNRAPKRVPTNR